MELLEKLNEDRSSVGLRKVSFLDLYRYVGVSKQAASLWVHEDVCKRTFPSMENKEEIAEFLMARVEDIWVNEYVRPKKPLDRNKKRA